MTDSLDSTLKFLEMVNGHSSAVDLSRGALLLSAHARPEIDLDGQVARIDALADRCNDPTLEEVRRVLFDDLGFAGDQDDYYNPENSLLDTVLDRGVGLPITLSLLLIEVGSRVGVALDGVAMPGHFLVRLQSGEGPFVDPFANGRTLDEPECRRLFHIVMGPGAAFDQRYLAPVTPQAILSRMVANLVNAYERADDRHGLRWAARLRARCPGVGTEELGSLANKLRYCAAFDEAAELFALAASLATGEPATSLENEAARSRSRMN